MWRKPFCSDGTAGNSAETVRNLLWCFVCKITWAKCADTNCLVQITLWRFNPSDAHVWVPVMCSDNAMLLFALFNVLNYRMNVIISITSNKKTTYRFFDQILYLYFRAARKQDSRCSATSRRSKSVMFIWYTGQSSRWLMIDAACCWEKDLGYLANALACRSTADALWMLRLSLSHNQLTSYGITQLELSF